MSAEAATGSDLPVKNVLVVGAGMAGLSAAISLSERGARVTVVERNETVEGTNIGINYRPLFALQELGVLDEVMEIGQCYEVGSDSRFQALFDANGNRLIPDGAAPALGDDWTLPITSVRLFRPELSEIMKDKAREHGATILMGESYRSLEPTGDVVDVELTTGDSDTYDLVVGADGINSELRERFFTEVGPPTYLGSIGCRVILEDVPDHWIGGQHLAPDGSNQKLVTSKYPDNRYYLAAGREMERRFVDQDEAREIVRGRLKPYLGTAQMFDEMYDRITDDMQVIVTATQCIYVPPPWNRGRIVLIGDAVHATAATIGSAGGMALEDGVVLGQELEAHGDVEDALTSFAERRKDRAKMVVDISAALMRSHHEHRPHEEESAMRFRAYQELVTPY